MLEYRPYPEFSWSNARDKLFGECERRYYWQYYGGWNGWLERVDERARAAYRLKHLTGYELALGSVVHECAKRCTNAVLANRPLPTKDQLRQQIRDALNLLYKGSKNRSGFLARPKQNPMLHAAYYGLSVSDRQMQRVRDRIDACIDNLLSSSVWDDLRRCSPEDVLVVDSVSSFMRGDLKVYAAPDLLYRRGRAWVIVDWKTGNPDEDSEDGQVAAYALYLRDGLGKTIEAGECVGRIVNLLDGSDRETDITPELMAAVESRIEQSVARMRSFVLDGDLALNAPVGEEEFGRRSDTSRCRWCNFYELCCGAESNT